MDKGEEGLAAGGMRASLEGGRSSLAVAAQSACARTAQSPLPLAHSRPRDTAVAVAVALALRASITPARTDNPAARTLMLAGKASRTLPSTCTQRSSMPLRRGKLCWRQLQLIMRMSISAEYRA